jgi:hypothetical protein
MKTEQIKLLKDKYTEYYNVFEDLKELNELTLELFDRENFGVEDIEDLTKLKHNLSDLNELIDNKMSDIYQEMIDKDF